MKAKPTEPGRVVISTQGHDAGRWHVIVSVLDARYVLICDGEARRLAQPKKKQVKHLSALPLTIPDFVHPQSKTVDFSGNLPPFLRPAVQKAAKLLSPRPVIDPERCIGCGKCAQSCPAQIIRIQAHKAKIHRGCIRCYCHEMCPVKAIHIRGRV